MTALTIATPGHAAAIRAIYAPYIEHTAFTFETEVPSTDAIARRIGKGLVKFPWLVCTVNEAVAGYVYASPHRDRDAYQWTCECSVYLAPSFHGRGLAIQLYSILFQLLKMQGLNTVYAGITLPNEASVRLHEKCGFEHFATYDNVGFKLGSWQKVGWWRLRLNEYNPNPTPPIKFSALDPLIVAALLSKGSETLAAKLSG